MFRSSCMLWLVLVLRATMVDGWTPLSTSRLFVMQQRRRCCILHAASPEQDGYKSQDSSVSPEEKMGLNELQTLLRNAVQRVDLVEAGRLSDILLSRLWQNKAPPKDKEELKQRRRRLSWRGLGAAPWLIDRLDSLNYTFPTTIQINAMESVNAILNNSTQVVMKETNDNDDDSSATLEERVGLLNDNQDMGIVISGTTGSGKTLAYLVPLLSTLSDSLFKRQRVRVGAEESVGDKTDDMLARVALVTSPVVRSSSRRQIKRDSAIATGAALSSLGQSGTNVKDPLALIVVPTRELGVQTAVVLYELVGGNIKQDPTEILPGKQNSFRYKGPKGVKIACILDDEDAEFGLKLQTDVAITTPKYLNKLVADNDVDPSKLRVVIFDEADLALEKTKTQDLDSLFNDDIEERDYSRLVFLVGASVTESLGNLAVKSRVLPEGKSYIATATRFAPLESHSNPSDGSYSLVGNQSETASLQDLDVCLDPGLRHERVVVADNTGLLALARLLRQELKSYNNTKHDDESERPRVVVFFPSEDAARASMETIRDALWGEHKLCALLPESGIRPLSMMEQFRAGKTSVMLATPNSVRGLDFPNVSHVYTLYLPMDDPREYVHLAGRVGRVGQRGSVLGGGGRVISILKEGEEADKMEVLAKELNFDFVDVEAPVVQDIVRTDEGNVDLNQTNVDELRRLLEDTITLVDLADDLGIDTDQLDDDDEDVHDEFNDEDAYQ